MCGRAALAQKGEHILPMPGGACALPLSVCQLRRNVYPNSSWRPVALLASFHWAGAKCCNLVKSIKEDLLWGWLLKLRNIPRNITAMERASCYQISNTYLLTLHISLHQASLTFYPLVCNNSFNATGLPQFFHLHLPQKIRCKSRG